MSEPLVTKDMSIMEVASKYPVAVRVFQAYGMGCLGCMAAQFENIEQGCRAHGMDPDVIVQSINDALTTIDATQIED